MTDPLAATKLIQLCGAGSPLTESEKTVRLAPTLLEQPQIGRYAPLRPVPSPGTGYAKVRTDLAP
jgi:hypothetical protein